MSPSAQIQALAQSVYLRVKNRQYDEITSADGQAFVANIIDFANGYLDELETLTEPDGKPLNWKWVEQLSYTLGTAATNTAKITLPSAVNNLIVEERRYVQVLQDGTPVSNWLVVAPEDIANGRNRNTEDMCTVTGTTLTFSRLFRDFENGGVIVGDVTTSFPRFSLTSAKSLSIIKPRELLVLGIAKNSALADIVKGSLTPSFVQKHQQLLDAAIIRNSYGGSASTIVSQDYGSIRGIF